MFGSKKTTDAFATLHNPAGTGPTVPPEFKPAFKPSTIQEPRLRPCYVQSRKALFHLWVHSARPVKPRGMEEDETAERYQLSATHGLVEFEDGTLARVWPQDIQFVDIRPEFQENVWPRRCPYL